MQLLVCLGAEDSEKLSTYIFDDCIIIVCRVWSFVPSQDFERYVRKLRKLAAQLSSQLSCAIFTKTLMIVVFLGVAFY